MLNLLGLESMSTHVLSHLTYLLVTLECLNVSKLGAYCDMGLVSSCGVLGVVVRLKKGSCASPLHTGPQLALVLAL